jgi:hypothetical protein
MTMTVYRSTDSGAPQLAGAAGSLAQLLDAVLVTGYKAFATATLTFSSNPADGETITIGSTVYTIKNTIVNPYDVLRTGTLAGTLANLQFAINGTGGTVGTTFPAGTVMHPDVWVPGAAPTTALTIYARYGGTAANSIATTETSAVGSWGGSTMSGGSNTVTKASAGWTKPFVNSGISSQYDNSKTDAVFKQPAGCQFYLMVRQQVNDAKVNGWESMSAFGISGIAAGGTTTLGSFPQYLVTDAYLRCSGSQDGVVRPWVIAVDDRTMHVWTQAGDVSGAWNYFYFGDFYSNTASDPYKCVLLANSTTSATATSTVSQNNRGGQTNSGASANGKWMPRSVVGAYGPRRVYLSSAPGYNAAAPTSNFYYPTAAYTPLVPNSQDGFSLLSWIRVMDYDSWTANPTTGQEYRGRLRGAVDLLALAAGGWADQDTIPGSGLLAGKTYTVFKTFVAAGGGAIFGMGLETSDTWDTSS